jgi:hypothetical protein
MKRNERRHSHLVSHTNETQFARNLFCIYLFKLCVSETAAVPLSVTSLEYILVVLKKQTIDFASDAKLFYVLYKFFGSINF